MYDLIMLDPPWPITLAGERIERATLAKELPYAVPKSMPELWNLVRSINNHGNTNCNYFVWTTESMLHATLNWFAWQQYSKHTTFIWDKAKGGFPAAFTIRPSHEYLIWFYKGKFTGVDDAVRGKFDTTFTELSREHSRKPEYVYNMLYAMFPAAKKLDAFSRQKREGWDSFGNETEKFN